ncbi:MAG: multidrug efflux RND transporter permease subunit [Methylobacter sp.]|nr:multidrug efflux RND transporter permease subunit [Methylobacter sp.]MDP2428928.1 multidrug efflux RND transporter permease subunit [Methylobacter sp.]MDP3056122.1 multidrug efflux RND transporter permease subunit [Methylobacter sp.]MDP3363459.1 multidrug efflux RND transporter permease subunit [Methylobacter sp.]MDZ4220084.1 multidrug efflux RND transporter permease subunit [Methylobacter sp.]
MNGFTHFFIDRPIFASVLSIIIVLLGGLALIGLPIAQYPEIAPPTVVVSAVYPGANAKVVAETVATTIEQEVNGVEDMLYMSSQSTNNGNMALTITFKPGTNLDKAQVLVQNRVALAEPKLPQEVGRQGISVKKRSPDLSLVVNLISPDKRYDSVYLSNYALLQLKDTIARLPGVGEIIVFGARDYSMRIWLNPEKIAVRNMTASDVVNAIREQNIQVAAGVVGQQPTQENTDFQYTISTTGRLMDAEQFADIVIKTGNDGQITRLKDVARIELGAKDYNSGLFLDGEPTVGLAIFQLPGSNALDTKKAVVDAMEKLKPHFPEGLDYLLVYDTVVFVQQSIEAVVKTLFEAMLLVVLVVVIFLQNWRATLIPLLAVPVSLIGTFAVMAALGLSLNTLSLFGLVLAIGIVVDDAIVVVENVERHIALGLSARDATRKAMTEVIGPIIATSLVLIAVFVPTAFITSVSGAFYKQFALTITISTVISTFNSLTLSPALCALLLDRAHGNKDAFTRLLDRLFGWFFRAFNRFFDRFSAGYARLVGSLVRMTAVVVILYLGLNALNFLAFDKVPTGFIPQQDQGYLILYAQLPDAASLARTQDVVQQATRIILDTEGVDHVNAYAGFSILSGSSQSNVATLFARLKSFDERSGHAGLHADNIIDNLKQRLARVEDARIAVFAPPPIRGMSSTGGFKLQIQDRSNAGIDALQHTVNDLIAKGNQQAGLVGLFTTFRSEVPQLFLDVDRTRAKAMDVPLKEIFDTLQIYLGSLYINDFNGFGRSFQVVAQADSAFRMNPDDIAKLKARNLGGGMVPLGSVLSVKDITGPDKITHYNLYPAAEINGSTLPGVSSGEAIAIMDKLLHAELPPGFDFEWTELSLQQVLAGDVAMLVFPLSVIFVFLALAAQYESWSLPLAVILIVPMCILSALAGVWLRDMDNNIFTQVGFIVLVGLASKNAILIVEFAKRRQEAGLNRFDAVIEASRIRLRPILMTSFAFIMGVFPLMVAQGAGAESRRLLGTTMFSGMLGVTLFGLLLTPVFFVIVQGWGKHKTDSGTDL